MTFEQILKNVIEKNASANKLFMRTAVKEELQNFVLNFIYNDNKYNKLIFTGGTCLRKVYGLNRLSEDLDFDYDFDFDIAAFETGLLSYFVNTLQYSDLRIKVSSYKDSLFLKFPILKKFNLYKNETPEDIFLRCDISEQKAGEYKTATNVVTAGSFQFFVISYDLSTLFSNKIAAFLERTFFKGKFQKIPFKGRDVYDLYWFLQLSARSGFNLKPNIPRLQALLNQQSTEEIKKQIKDKIVLIDEKFVYEDLLSLVESGEFIKGFKDYIINNIDLVL